MSKVKLGFSLLLAIFFVGILSSAVFAAPDNNNTPSSYNPDVTGLGTDMSTVKDGGLAADDKGNDNNYNQTDKSNANKTGTDVGGNTNQFDHVIKSDGMVKADGTKGTQRTHGSYMNNTNSCASCHQTHTGASKNLLFKDGEYATCTACHDGTLGFYNVFTGSNSAGKFGGTHDGNMSVHLANGTVELKAAPGGNHDSTSENWEAEFTCASCHAPHGSYSDRLLHENPNEMGNTLVQQGGKRLENVPVVDANTVVDLPNPGDKFTINTKYAAATVTYKNAANLAHPNDPNYPDQEYNYVIYKFKIGDAGAPTNKKQVYNSTTKKWVDSTDPKDDYYAAKGLTTGDTVVQLMKWNGTKYVIDTDPWLHGYGWDAGHANKIYWTKFMKADGTAVFDTDQLKKGEVLGQGFAGVLSTNAGAADLNSKIDTATKANISRGYVVKLDIGPLNANNVADTTVSSLWASKLQDGVTVNPGYVPNRGVAMSNFCSACHTDYLAGSGKDSGTFDHAYRHTTTSDSYTCVRCHYAHGTDVTIMRDSRGKQVADIVADPNYFSTVTDPTARQTLATEYMLDKNPSSALKRYTNMAVCWACHTSSHSEGTRNTDTFQYNPTANESNDRNGIEFDY